MSSLLISIDLEDVRDWVAEGNSYREAVPDNTRRYLEQFKRWGIRATFFIVGTVARRYPELIGEIQDCGHELACHGDTHVQLDKLSPAAFKADLQANLSALYNAGAATIKGFRAPTFSLTKQTEWAFTILAELGFSYSSSVLPAKNPLYGWPEFGSAIRKTTAGVWELPITLHDLPGMSVPIAGGVYFRVLPFVLTRWAIQKKIRLQQPVGTYFHPYDIDVRQERFMHPDLNNRKHLNMLMYIGRSKVLSRLDRLHASFPFSSYEAYVTRLERGSGSSQTTNSS